MSTKTTVPGKVRMKAGSRKLPEVVLRGASTLLKHILMLGTTLRSVAAGKKVEEDYCADVTLGRGIDPGWHGQRVALSVRGRRSVTKGDNHSSTSWASPPDSKLSGPPDNGLPEYSIDVPDSKLTTGSTAMLLHYRCGASPCHQFIPRSLKIAIASSQPRLAAFFKSSFAAPSWPSSK